MRTRPGGGGQQIRTPADKEEGGVKNRGKFADVLYGRPLTVFGIAINRKFHEIND